jgi:hypothetical protein
VIQEFAYASMPHSQPCTNSLGTFVCVGALVVDDLVESVGGQLTVLTYRFDREFLLTKAECGAIAYSTCRTVDDTGREH